MCHLYLDDNLIHSLNFENHVNHLRLCHRYQKSGVKLGPQRHIKEKSEVSGEVGDGGEGYTMDLAEVALVQALKENTNNCWSCKNGWHFCHITGHAS